LLEVVPDEPDWVDDLYIEPFVHAAVLNLVWVERAEGARRR
jgi:hypothetical protein